MKKILFISRFLLLFLIGTLHISVAAAAPDLDLQTLIAGIKHFDAAATAGRGTFVYNHALGTREEKREYDFAFDGATFEDAQVRVDSSKSRILSEIYDGERQWEVYERKAQIFSVDITPDDYERLNKEDPELPSLVRQKFKELGIHVSADFRIEADEGSSYSKMIDTVTGNSHYIYYTEEYFSFYETHLEYGVRPGCVIGAYLDPRYWMTFGKATPSSYLMTPLWKVLEDNETEILKTEMLNGEETYLVRVKHPDVKSPKLWISVEKGFRLVKLQEIFEVQEETQSMPFKKGIRYLKERYLHYHEYLPGVWFPENVEQTIHSLLADTPEKKGELIGKTTLQAVSFQLNVDVSNQFQLDVPEDTPVFDYGTAKLRPYRELKQ